MGCGSSNAQTALESNGKSSGNDGDNVPQTNGSVKNVVRKEDDDKKDATTPEVPNILVPPAEAFEIPFDDDNSNGLIKKHPPKRIQRLEELANTLAPPTIEELEEKLAVAELRRQEFLNQKVNAAKQMQKTGNDDSNEEEGQVIQEDENTSSTATLNEATYDER